jgi:signal transduction histidine kinase
VHNAGPGIPPHYRDRVFDWFSQAEAGNTRRNDGSGLSLAASRLIVERHGGTIGFHSADETGTVFSVELPMVSRRAKRVPGRATRVNK